MAGRFLIVSETLATGLTAWLPLRGKTSPAPGEDVTVGDKRGNLARERLRGFVPNPSRENGIAERPQTLRYPKIINNDSAEYAQSNAARIQMVFFLGYTKASRRYTATRYAAMKHQMMGSHRITAL